MSSSHSLEVFGILVIIGVQIYFFWETYKKIKEFKGIFPSREDNKISKVPLLSRDLEKSHPLEILVNLSQFTVRAAAERKKNEEADVANIALVDLKSTNPTAQTINYSINTYLLRNTGASPDFNLIKDIVERNSDGVEEEVANAIPIPLYLGLLGTLLGIVVGLSDISGMSFENTAGSTNVLDVAIPTLLSGVKVAMIASFTGLLLTIAHSGFYFKKAKAHFNNSKNVFFTFLQVELLPILNQNLNSTLYSLQANLIGFNKEFGTNISRLDKLMNKNYDTLVAQESVMKLLSEVDIAEFAKANVKVLKELKLTTASFGDFNEYIGQVNSAVRGASMIIVKINELMNRLDNMESAAQHIVTTFDANHELMEFLKSHFSSLDTSKQMIANAVVTVNDTLSTALDHLQSFTVQKIASVRNIEIRESNLLENEYPEKWKNLDELKKLTQVIEHLQQGNINSAKQVELISQSISEVKESIEHLENNMNVGLRVPSFNWFKKDKVYSEEEE